MRRWRLFTGCSFLAIIMWVFTLPSADAFAACGSDPPSGTPFEWPIEGAVVGSWTLDCAADRGHRGIDIASSQGEVVRAAAAGTVAFAGYTPAEGGGLTVAIDHIGGLRTTYLHLKTLQVVAGQTVVTGQNIGSSNGEPLHFGVKRPGARDVYFDPLGLLPVIFTADTPAVVAPSPDSQTVAPPSTSPAQPAPTVAGDVVEAAGSAITLPAPGAATTAVTRPIDSPTAVPYADTLRLPAPSAFAPGIPAISGESPRAVRWGLSDTVAGHAGPLEPSWNTPGDLSAPEESRIGPRTRPSPGFGALTLGLALAVSAAAAGAFFKDRGPGSGEALMPVALLD